MMLDISVVLAEELSFSLHQVKNACKLFDEGATVPFVARYRKEQTDGLDEVALRTLLERRAYLAELEKRKEAILKSIRGQKKLTDDLREQIEACRVKTELEDLYLPFRPRRRTRATQAREQGLEPLAGWIRARNRPGVHGVDLSGEAAKYVRPDRGVKTVEEALQGASDILAEAVAERADLRAYIRTYLTEHGVFRTTFKPSIAQGSTNYEMYRDFCVPVSKVAAHNLLALLRAEAEGVLSCALEFDEVHVVGYLERKEVHADDAGLRAFLKAMVQDAFARLMKKTLVNDVRQAVRESAEETSIQAFAANLKELLLASPAGMRPTIGIDPGFRTGCKLVVLDATGKLLTHRTIYPHLSVDQRSRAEAQLRELVAGHAIELIAIGNGTAGRETDAFVTRALAELPDRPTQVLVSEAGASVYSASTTAAEEFPDLDLTIRGAVSIGRRLQDPLAELVKIDPKSIGVGQYQHDVDQGKLKQKLEETVESCVNYVGVNLNLASAELLQYVAGVTPSLAQNIVAYRDEHGAFRDRRALLKVPRFGPKAFEQAAGFLRIRDGRDPLDNTAVHPEAYPVVKAMARDLGVPTARVTLVPQQLKQLDLKRYVTKTIGEPTLRDILAELEKPGRDPRAEFRYATFREDIQAIEDLKEGMRLEGVVTNVANFGAFVDIGVHRDGLVHISQLADRYVTSPHDVVKVGQVVEVRVLDVDTKLGRISLSMREEQPERTGRRRR